LTPAAASYLTDLFQNLQKYLPASYAPLSLYFASDYGVWYVNNGSAWVYFSGIYEATLANIPTGLGVNDQGFLFYGTDYVHTWLWTGSGWRFSDGDTSGQIVGVDSGNSTPSGGSWVKCDNANHTCANSDATTSSRKADIISGASDWYLRK
jgi:hypothetical protein